MSDFEEDDILVDAHNFKEKVKKSAKISLFKIITRSFFSVSVLTLILVYLLSPIGRVKINKLSGNFYLSSDDILEIADLSKKDSLLGVKEDVIMKKLNKSSYIASSNVSWHMTYLDIYVDEVAPIAKTSDDIILSNGVTLTDYQNKMKHDDYDISKNLELPSFINYDESNFSAIFLNAMKYLDKDLFQKILYLDESSVIKSIPLDDGICFGVYFKIDDELLRLQIQKSIVVHALQNKDVLLSTIDSFKSFGKIKMNIEDKDQEVYEALYYFDGQSYKVVSFEEGR